MKSLLEARKSLFVPQLRVETTRLFPPSMIENPSNFVSKKCRSRDCALQIKCAYNLAKYYQVEI